jgi:DNA-binding transcriptional LysR family regulator
MESLMTRGTDLDSRVGRSLRLRDLHAFFLVCQRGSMAKAAAQLGVSQPAVSELIARLEQTLRVRLLDRSPQGVEPTKYGRVLLQRGFVAFDELKQSIRDIEFLADPTLGELRIGCPESISSGALQPIIRKFKRDYPRVVLHIEEVNAPTLELPALRSRSLDLVFARLIRPPSGDPFANDLSIETLFEDELAVVAGKDSKWARRRGIDLAELVAEPWTLTAPGTWTHSMLAEAFQARGTAMPELDLVTFSVHVRANLVANGSFVTALPASFLSFNADRFSLKVLPIDLPVRPWPVTLITLKGRALSPVAERFIECARRARLNPR